MATAVAFTTYAALLTVLKNQLMTGASAGEFRIQSKTMPTGETVTFKSVDQLKNEIERIGALAYEEADTQERSRFTPIQIRRAL